MISKNISIEIRKNEKVPIKETYLVFYKQKNKVKVEQKFIDDSLNQSITLKREECKRLINLLTHFMFDGEFKPIKDRMIIYEAD